MPWPLARRRDTVTSPLGEVMPAAPKPRPMPVSPQPDPPADPNRSETKYREPEPWQVAALGAPWLLAEIGSLDLLASRGGDLTAHQAVHLEDL